MQRCVECAAPLPPLAAVCPSCKRLQRRDAPSLGPGTQIDRGYARIVVDQKIGSGAMGVVYRAWMFLAPATPRASEPPRLVALKQLKPQASSNPDIRRLFTNEAEALRQLQHPNVVGFLDLFEWTPPPIIAKTSPLQQVDPARVGVSAPAPQGRLTLAMELVEGDGLDLVIARNVARSRLAGTGPRGLPFARAFSYFEQLLGGLAAAHALGIVHRDVKPSNVMIRRDGMVKLADFGIAHLRGPDAEPLDGRFAPGTGQYMSPEQVHGTALDGRSDLYSAAIVFYETLAGRTPFLSEGRTELLVRMDQVERTPPPIAAFLADAPPALDLVFARALAKAPHARYPSAIELGDAFARALGLTPSRGWAAQAEMAALAPGAGSQRLATVRLRIEQGYATLAGLGRPSVTS